MFTPSCHISLCYQRKSSFHLSISGEQVPFSCVPTLPSVHCRSHSCCFRQQLSAAPLPSFPTSLTVYGCVFVAGCRHSCSRSSAPGLQHSLVVLVSSAHKSLYLLVVVVNPVLMCSVCFYHKTNTSTIVFHAIRIFNT